MSSVLSEKVRTLLNTTDIRSAVLQTLAGAFLTLIGNFLLQIFSWTYDNYPLTILASLLSAAVLVFTAYQLIKNIGSVFRMKRSDKQTKVAPHWRYRWQRFKTRIGAYWEEFRAKQRQVLITLFCLLILTVLAGVFTVNLFNYIRIRAALEHQDGGVAQLAKRIVQGRYLIVLENFEERGTLSETIAFPQRMLSALKGAKENYALPLDFLDRPTILNLDSLAKIYTSIYLISGWYDARDVKVEVRQVVDSTRRVEYLAAKWGIYAPAIINQIKFDTLLQAEESPNRITNPLVGEYLLRIGVQKDVQYFVTRMIGDLFFDEFQLTQRIRALSPEAIRFLPALYDANYIYSISESNITREVHPLVLFPQPNKHLNVYGLYEKQCKTNTQLASILVRVWTQRTAKDRTVNIPEDSIRTIEWFSRLADQYREKYTASMPERFAKNDSIRLYNGINNLLINKANTMAGLFRIQNQCNDLNVQTQRELQLATAAGNSANQVAYLKEIKSSAINRRTRLTAMRKDLEHIQARDKQEVARLEDVLTQFSEKHKDKTSQPVVVLLRLFLVGDSLIQMTTQKTIDLRRVGNE